MSEPAPTIHTPAPFPTRRLIVLVLLGIVLTPLAAVAGAAFLPGALVIWIAGLALAAIATLWTQFFALLFAPVIIGSMWAWPVTCVVLPLAGILVRRAGPRTPIPFAALGAVTGAAAGFGLIVSHTYEIEFGYAGWYALSGAIGGGVAGALFGYVLWRMDRPK